MRFDDSLDTVMASDMMTPFGAQSGWRQLVDLIARRRIAISAEAVERLRLIRASVPAAVRSASARAAADADPPAALVRLFANDDPAIAAPMLAAARLDSQEWIDMLPTLPPTARALLRHRRDLPTAVIRALRAFGATDFVLPTPDAEAMERALAAEAVTVSPSTREQPAEDAPAMEAPTGPFRIADLVARIDAYRSNHEITPVAASPDRPIDDFRFETDERGTIRWVDGAPRAPLIGLTLGVAAARVDGVVSGAFRRRGAFSDARLLIEGRSTVAGQWQLSGVPAFDPASGRFTGYRGVARRPRVDERAELAGQRGVAPDSLRQLVHELRTPTNAISGFAELIEAQVFGPASETYRGRARDIRGNVRDLLDAIDDVDTAARIEQNALVLRPRAVAVAPLLARVEADLAPLTDLHLASMEVAEAPEGLAIVGDPIAVERVVARLVATSMGAAAPAERIAIRARLEEAQVVLEIDRPRAFAALSEGDLLRLEQDDPDERGAVLLGAGFTLRLARNLAAELGGGLAIGDDRLTLRLPAALDHPMEQQSSH